MAEFDQQHAVIVALATASCWRGWPRDGAA
jgi:hypothetical protein